MKSESPQKAFSGLYQSGDTNIHHGTEEGSEGLLGALRGIVLTVAQAIPYNGSGIGKYCIDNNTCPYG